MQQLSWFGSHAVVCNVSPRVCNTIKESAVLQKVFNSLPWLSLVSRSLRLASSPICLASTECCLSVAEEGPTDNTSEKVSELLQPPLQQPPPFADLATYVAAALPTKLPVPEAMYHRLRTQDRALAGVIEPLSASGAEALATLIGSALDSEEFQPTDEITIGGESLVSINHATCKNPFDL